MLPFPNINKMASNSSFDDICVDPVAAKRYKFAARREFSQRKKWKATQVRDPRAKRDFSAAETACFDGNAAVRNHRRRQLGVDGHDADGGCGARGRRGRRISNGVRDYCTQPCIGIYVAGDSLAPTAGGRWWRLQHGQTL